PQLPGPECPSTILVFGFRGKARLWRHSGRALQVLSAFLTPCLPASLSIASRRGRFRGAHTGGQNPCQSGLEPEVAMTLGKKSHSVQYVRAIRPNRPPSACRPEYQALLTMR